MKIAIMPLLLIIVLGFVEKACDMKDDTLDKEFTIKAGQTTSIRSEGFAITFVSVAEDSRCPEGVDCVWVGNAKVVLKLSKANGESHTVELNTTLQPKEVTYQQYLVRLVKLTPYPKQNSTIKKEDYEATLMVSKTSR
ncbi:MAG TPA: hypothetical protein VNN73_10200 [Blastocatellia bacterium]|nr:hypothetical protein [Blastocatellia bacterium]